MSKTESLSETQTVSGRAGDVSDLDVLLCNEPGSVCQQLVERLQAAEFGGSALEAGQPALLPSGLQEAGAVLLDHVLTMVASSGLCDIGTSPD